MRCTDASRALRRQPPGMPFLTQLNRNPACLWESKRGDTVTAVGRRECTYLRTCSRALGRAIAVDLPASARGICIWENPSLEGNGIRVAFSAQSALCLVRSRRSMMFSVSDSIHSIGSLNPMPLSSSMCSRTDPVIQQAQALEPGCPAASVGPTYQVSGPFNPLRRGTSLSMVGRPR